MSGGSEASSTSGGTGGANSGRMDSVVGLRCGKDGGGSLGGSVARQDRGGVCPPALSPAEAPPRFAASWSFWLVVKQFQAEKVAMERGSVGTRVHQLERQRPDWLTGLELRPQQWQHRHGGNDDGVTSRLRRQSRLALEWCR